MQQAVIWTVCAALLLSGCDKAESGTGVNPALDASSSGAVAFTDAGAPEATAASTRDGALPAVTLDGGSQQRPADIAVGDAGTTQSASAGPATVDASQGVPPVVSADAGVVTDPSIASWGNQPCDQASDKPGCKDKSLALCICRGPDASGGNEFCCNDKWSYLCADGVAALPECRFTTTKCCEAHPTDGCENPTVSQCICDEVRRQKQEESAAGRDPASVHDCCSEGWSDFCAILADTVCNAGCSAKP